MVKQVEAYECGVCNEVIVGSLEEAVEHEAIPKGKALRKGFVAIHAETPSLNLFYLVAEDGTLEKDHKYHQNQFALFLGQEPYLEMSSHKAMPINYEHMKKLLTQGDLRTLNPDELEDFRLRYVKMPVYDKMEIGVNPEEINSDSLE